MSKTQLSISFIDLLPDSIASDPVMAAAAEALDKHIRAVNDAIGNILLYSRIDDLLEDQLKHLAWQWHVDFWDDDLPIDKLRTLVKQSYAWHKKKGTPAAVEEMVKDVLGGGYIQEWFQYGGEPYHFNIYSNSPPDDTETFSRLMLAVNTAKNERSVLNEIINAPSIKSYSYFAGIVVSGSTVTIPDEGNE
ncbi:MAG: phage tail protein I [Desulfobacteraceae bacterium]|nr:phage tail protein I [Desulfobacteraceae bacterium]